MPNTNDKLSHAHTHTHIHKPPGDGFAGISHAFVLKKKCASHSTWGEKKIVLLYGVNKTAHRNQERMRWEMIIGPHSIKH